MGFGEKFSALKKKAGDKAKEMKLDEKLAGAKKQLSDSMSELREKNAEQKALTNEAKAPVEGAIIRYQVTYRGGFEQKPKKKSDALTLGFNILPDRFVVKPEYLAKKEWFGDEVVEVPYESVKLFEIVKRQVSSAEAFLSSSGDTKSLEQENNIEITYVSNDGKERKIRMEMLTGITVYGQAEKCREMMDLLREHGILEKIERNRQNAGSTQQASSNPVEQIAKLAELKNMGILSEEEFEKKKAELLSRL